MSRQVDERVVSMQFDNAKFEKNVSTTMSTLDKLKHALKFDGVSKGLEDINQAAGKVHNIGGLGSAVEAVSAKFSALQVMGVTALANITNSAVNAGKKLVESLTVDQITSGWNKYEQKTSSVQTIMNATGKSIDEVNQYLNKLMRFSDETSYSFTDMTSGLATMVSSGGDINKLIPLIMGVANATAFAGKGAAEFSRVLQYGVNQAYSLGYMQVQDWKTLEGATVNSKQLMQSLIDAGVAAGNIEVGEVTTNNFRESLSDKWLTSEVMEEGFSRFSKFANAAIDAVDAGTYETVTEAMAAMEAEYEELGVKAFKSAQQAKSFTEAIDATKDAVSSGWMKTAELVFGNFEQATKLWTDVCGVLWELFAAGGEIRNAILESALGKNFQALLNPIVGIKETLDNIAAPVKDVTKTLEDYNKVVNEIIDGKWGTMEARWNALTEAGYDWATAQNMVNEKIGVSKRHQTEYVIGQESMATAGDKTYKANSKLIAQLSEYSDEQLRSIGVDEDKVKMVSEIRKQADKLGLSVEYFVDNIDEINGRWVLLNIFRNAWAGIVKVFEAVKEAWQSVFPPKTIEERGQQLYDLIAAIHKFSTQLIMPVGTAEKVTRTFKGLFAVLDIIGTLMGGSLRIALKVVKNLLEYFEVDILDITAAIGDSIVKFHKWFESMFDITWILDGIAPAISSIISALKKWYKEFTELPEIKKLLSGISDLFVNIKKKANDGVDTITKWVSAFDGIGVVTKVLDRIGEAIKWIDSVVANIITSFSQWFNKFKETEDVKKLVNAVTELITVFGELFAGNLDSDEFASKLGSALGKIMRALADISVELLKSFMSLITSDDAVQFGKDFLAGFAIGVLEGTVDIIKSVVGFCVEFIKAFADALGIESPSVIAYEDGQYWVEGFYNGVVDAANELYAKLKPVFDSMLKVLRSFWDYITDESGGVEWGKLVAAGITIESLVILNTLTKSLDKFASAATSFSSMFSGVAGLINEVKLSIERIGRAASANLNAEAVLKLAIAVGIIAGAVWLIATQLGDDYGKIWNAVGVIGALTLLIIGLSFAVSMLGKASVKWDRGPQIEGLQTGLLQIGLVLIGMAAAVRMIGELDPDQFKQGLIGLGAISAAIIAMLGITVLLANQVKGNAIGLKLAPVGKMLMSMAVAMALMAVAFKIVGTLSAEEMLQGGTFAAAFALFVMGITAVTKNSTADVAKASLMIMGIVVAMGLMVGVCKLLKLITVEEMLRGAACMLAFGLLVKYLTWCVQGRDGTKIGGITGLVLSVSLSLLLIAGTCKIIESISNETLIRGGIVVSAFIGLMALLVRGLSISNDKQIAKIGAAVIAMSAAILIMAGTAVILSMVPEEGLWRGVAIVSIFGLVVSAMAAALKNAVNVKTAINSLTILVVVLVASVVALSMIDDDGSVEKSVACILTLLAGLTAVLISMKGLSISGSTVGSLAVLSGIILVLGGLLIIFAHYADMFGSSADDFIKFAVALGVLLASLAASLAIVSRSKSDYKGAFKPLGELVIMLAGIAVILAFMSNKITDPWKTIPSAIALGILLNALASSMLILSKSDRISKTVSDNLRNMMGVIVVAGIVMGCMASWTTEPWMLIPSAIALGILLNTLATAMLIMGEGKRISKTVTDSLSSMIGVIFISGIIMSLMSLVPNPMGLIPVATGLGILLNAMASALLIMSYAKTNYSVTLGQLMSLSLAVAAIGVVLGVLSTYANNAASMIPIAVAIGILLNSMATALMVMSYAGIYTVSLGQLMSLSLAVAVIGTILGVLSTYASNVASMIPIAIGIGILLNAMATALLLLSYSGPNITASIGPMLAMAAVVAILAVVFSYIRVLDAISLIPIATALGIALIAMSAACLIASLIPAPAAISGALGLAAFIAIIGAVVAAFGALALIPGFKWMMTDGAIVMSVIGAAIGGFLNGIIVGVGSAVISLIPTLGYALEEFGKGLAPFLSVVESFSAGTVVKVGFLAAVLGALAVSSFVSSLYTLGGLGLVSLGAQLVIFGASIAAFDAAIKGIDSASIDAATNVATLMALLTANDIIGKISSLFLGGVDYAAINTNLQQFAGAVVSFSEAISGKINSEAIKAATDAGYLFVALQDALPKTGGILETIVGKKDFGAFAEACDAFIDVIIKLNDRLSETNYDIQSEKIEAVVTAGKHFSDLAHAIPKSEGFLQTWVGKNDLNTFATAVDTFAEKIIAINNTLSEGDYVIQSDKIEAIATAGTKFSDLANALPKSEGFLQTWIGKKDLDAFGTAVQNFATCVLTINSQLVGDGFAINLQAIDDIKVAGEKMNELQNALPKKGSWWESVSGSKDLGSFGDGIKAFGTAIVTFSNEAAQLNMTAIDNAISTTNRIKGLITGLVGLNTSGIKEFTGVGTGGIGADGPPYKIAKAITGFSKEVSGIDPTRVSTAVDCAIKIKDLIKELSTLKDSGVTAFVNAVKEMGDVDIDAILNNYERDFYLCGKYLADGFRKGITDSTAMTVRAVESMCAAAERALRKILKINSPSKVFAELGEGVPEGFAKGVTELSGTVDVSVSDMASNAINTARGAITGILGAFGGDDVLQPTIRPVVDLSNVQTGASAVSSIFNGVRSIGVQTNLNAANLALTRNSQNGVNDEVVASINKLRNDITTLPRNTYSINGITYDDGSNIHSAIEEIARYALRERRV